MKTTEIEIKVKVERIDKLQHFLNEEAQSKGEVHQVDEYFSPAHRDFLSARPTKEWLRLRDADGTYSINYKNWHYDDSGRSQYCDEYESKIENLELVQMTFKALDMRSLAVVDKHRHIWHYHDYEVAVDSVRDLGDFVEIEYIGNEAHPDPKVVTDGMVRFLKDHNCGKIEQNYQGYPFLLMFPEEAKWEEV